MRVRGFHVGNEIILNKGLRWRPLSAILLTSLNFGCGLPGGIAVSNESVPTSATLVTSGNLSGAAGVSGTAMVYLNGSAVLLHLEGLVTPAGTLYSVFLENGNPSSPFYFSQLTAVRGNQNYFTGRAPDAAHFSRVAIRATTSTSSQEMASATLTFY